MGVFTPREFALKLAELSTVVGTVPVKGIVASSRVVQRNVMAITPSHLRNAGKRGAALGVRYTVTESAASASSVVRATGPFQLVERDTEPHAIVPKAAAGRHTALWIGADTFAASVQHPGTRGKHTFEKGVMASQPEIEKIFTTGAVEAIHSVL